MKNPPVRLAGFSLVLFSLSGCGYKSAENAQSSVSPKAAPTIQIASKIKIKELEPELARLKNHQTEYDFIGITSNGIDCLYFMLDGERFNLDFEAMVPDQISYVEKLKKWAGSNHFRYTMTTYNNQPKYPSDHPAPVIHIKTNSSIEMAAKLGGQIEKDIFRNSDENVYEVVP